MIQAVIFDLDDTLYDEIDYCRSGFDSVSGVIAALPGAPDKKRVFDCLWDEFASGNRTRTFNAALEKLGINCDNRLVAELVETYRNHIPNIKLPIESRDTLSRLREKYSLALLTDGFLPAQRYKVRALSIEKYFKSIIYTEELGRDCWKPSPAGFLKLIESLNVAPKAAVYIADNEKKDFIAPNKLGILTVRLIRPSRIHTESAAEPAAAAKHTIHKIIELPQLLKKL